MMAEGRAGFALCSQIFCERATPRQNKIEFIHTMDHRVKPRSLAIIGGESLSREEIDPLVLQVRRSLVSPTSERMMPPSDIGFADADLDGLKWGCASSLNLDLSGLERCDMDCTSSLSPNLWPSATHHDEHVVGMEITEDDLWTRVSTTISQDAGYAPDQPDWDTSSDSDGESSSPLAPAPAGLHDDAVGMEATAATVSQDAGFPPEHPDRKTAPAPDNGGEPSSIPATNRNDDPVGMEIAGGDSGCASHDDEQRPPPEGTTAQASDNGGESSSSTPATTPVPVEVFTQNHPFHFVFGFDEGYKVSHITLGPSVRKWVLPLLESTDVQDANMRGNPGKGGKRRVWFFTQRDGQWWHVWEEGRDSFVKAPQEKDPTAGRYFMCFVCPEFPNWVLAIPKKERCFEEDSEEESEKKRVAKLKIRPYIKRIEKALARLGGIPSTVPSFSRKVERSKKRGGVQRPFRFFTYGNDPRVLCLNTRKRTEIRLYGNQYDPTGAFTFFRMN